MQSKGRIAFIFLIVVSMLGLPVLADRTPLKQGLNLFTVQQDTEMGRELAEDANNSLALVTDSYALGYIQALGSQLAVHAPGTRYSYQFKIVNDKKINAFALPGGFIYVTSGLIEAAQNEPQLAGIIAHEIGHVAMRHGTQAVSKAYSSEFPESKNVSVASAMDQLDISFEPNSIVLKYSTEAERQADLFATQILYDARFDPRQMTAAFQSFDKEPASLTADFWSNHPRTANRAGRVRREIQNMGGLRSNWRGDSPDLHKTQERLRGETTSETSSDRTTRNAPELPSTRMISYQGRDLDFRYPNNWHVSEEGSELTVAPEGGVISGALAYGMRIATFDPQNRGFFGQNSLNVPGSQRSFGTTLEKATDQLLDELRRSNPNMRVIRDNERGRVDGEPSMTVELTNDSPVGGRETDWIVTVLRPDGLLYYFVGVVPQRDFNRYSSTFDQIVNSVRFND